VQKQLKTLTSCPELSGKLCRVAQKKEAPIVSIRGAGVPIKIYRGKSHGYDVFVLAYYSGGKRKRESFSNFQRAKDRGNELRCALINNRLGVAEMDNADREAYVRALSLLRPLGIPLHSAIEEYVAARSLLVSEPLLAAVQSHVARRPSILKPVGDIVTELILTKAREGCSKRYLETLRHHLNRFAAAFQTTIGSITAPMITDWLTTFSTARPRSRNNIRTNVVTLFKFAQRRGYLAKGPSEAEDVPLVKDRGGDIGILTPTELAQVLLAPGASEETKLYLAIGAFTGLRSAEIVRLEWKDVNFERAFIEVGKDKAKTATRRLVPILPNLMMWLAACRGRTGFVLERSAKGEAVEPRGGEHPAARARGHAKKVLGKWPANALRHSYATYRLAETCDAARVALEMGNSPQMLFRNYRELADQRDAAAWFSILPQRAENVVSFVAG